MMHCPPYDGLWANCDFTSAGVSSVVEIPASIEAAFIVVLVAGLLLAAIIVGAFVKAQTD